MINDFKISPRNSMFTRADFIFTRSGFTLIEVMVALMIVAALAVVALPRLGSVVERAKAKEGEQFLYEILRAQKRYSINNDNGDATPDYAEAVADLDIDPNVGQNFFPLNDSNISSVNPIGRIIRISPNYTLTIRDNGDIACNCGGAVCAICTGMGYSSP